MLKIVENCPIVKNKKTKKTKINTIVCTTTVGQEGGTSLVKPISNPSDYSFGTLLYLLTCKPLFRAEICHAVLELRQVLKCPGSTEEHSSNEKGTTKKTATQLNQTQSMIGKDVIQKNDVLLRPTARLSFTSEGVKKKAEDKTDKVAHQQHSMRHSQQDNTQPHFILHSEVFFQYI